jgi:hypothetical protein
MLSEGTNSLSWPERGGSKICVVLRYSLGHLWRFTSEAFQEAILVEFTEWLIGSTAFFLFFHSLPNPYSCQSLYVVAGARKQWII